MSVTPDDIAASTPADDETIFERRMRALTLRNGGATYTQIAERTGVSIPTARKDVRMAYREVVNEPAEDKIARQRAILHDVHRAHFARALNGDIDSSKIVLDCLKVEAQLFGLNAPARVAVGVTDMEFAEQAVELIAGLGRIPQDEMLASLDTEKRAALGLPTPKTPGVIDAEVIEADPFDLPHGPTPLPAKPDEGETEPWADV